MLHMYMPRYEQYGWVLGAQSFPGYEKLCLCEYIKLLASLSQQSTTGVVEGPSDPFVSFNHTHHHDTAQTRDIPPNRSSSDFSGR